MGIIDWLFAKGRDDRKTKSVQKISILKSKRIGDQEWLTENLNVNTFRNGEPIPEARSVKEWVRAGKEGKPAWCYYAKKPEDGKKYGKLFNWYAVNDPRGLAPQGWRIPSNAEWQTLADHLGGHEVAGGKMRETGTAHWRSPNTGATNESSFSALPGGYRFDNGSYDGIGEYAGFWSSTEDYGNRAWHQHLTFKNLGVYCLSYEKGTGISVRCLREYTL